MQNTQIKINGIQADIIIGCFDYERTARQKIIIDLMIDLYPYNWNKVDLLNHTIDYDDLIDLVKNLSYDTKYNLLESLAQYLSNKLLDTYSLICKIHVSLTKTALNGMKADSVSVSFTQERKFNIAIALGSNSEHAPMQQLVTAIELLNEHIDEIQVGGFYETKPYGHLNQNNFYNTAIIGKTSLLPHNLLAKTKMIEKIMNKQEIFANGPRIIDIDLLLFENLIYSNQFLKIPHKDLIYRDFVLTPLNDVASSWVHPELKLSIKDLCSKINDVDKTIIKKVLYSK